MKKATSDTNENVKPARRTKSGEHAKTHAHDDAKDTARDGHERADDQREQLFKMMEGFDSAMLVTRDGRTMRSRPLAIARVEAEKGRVLFATAIDSPKVAELEARPEVLLTMQGRTQYVSFIGNCVVNRSRELIDELWKPSWKLWFPEGKDDPRICILEVEGTEAQFWDLTSGRTLATLFDRVVHALKGDAEPAREGNDHKVTLG